jgi:hypothetical protein
MVYITKFDGTQEIIINEEVSKKTGAINVGFSRISSCCII